MSNIHDVPQQNASEFYSNNQAKTSNKEVYIIVTEDPTIKAKFTTYVQGINPKQIGNFLEIVGSKVTNNNILETLAQKQKEDITHINALKIVKKECEEQEHLQIPINKIVRIKVLKFKTK